VRVAWGVLVVVVVVVVVAASERAELLFRLELAMTVGAARQSRPV
jgi:hypothetical protein